MMNLNARVQQNTIPDRGTILNDRVVQKNASTAHFCIRTDVRTRMNQIREIISYLLRRIINAFAYGIIADRDDQQLVCVKSFGRSETRPITFTPHISVPTSTPSSMKAQLYFCIANSDTTRPKPPAPITNNFSVINKTFTISGLFCKPVLSVFLLSF